MKKAYILMATVLLAVCSCNGEDEYDQYFKLFQDNYKNNVDLNSTWLDSGWYKINTSSYTIDKGTDVQVQFKKTEFIGHLTPVENKSENQKFYSDYFSFYRYEIENDEVIESSSYYKNGSEIFLSDSDKEANEVKRYSTSADQTQVLFNIDFSWPDAEKMNNDYLSMPVKYNGANIVEFIEREVKDEQAKRTSIIFGGLWDVVSYFQIFIENNSSSNNIIKSTTKVTKAYKSDFELIDIPTTGEELENPNSLILDLN